MPKKTQLSLYTCDICQRSEVRESGEPVVDFRTVILDAGQPGAQSFMMCPHCVKRAFGPDAVDEEAVALCNQELINVAERLSPAIFEPSQAEVSE